MCCVQDPRKASVGTVPSSSGPKTTQVKRGKKRSSLALRRPLSSRSSLSPGSAFNVSFCTTLSAAFCVCVCVCVCVITIAPVFSVYLLLPTQTTTRNRTTTSERRCRRDLAAPAPPPLPPLVRDHTSVQMPPTQGARVKGGGRREGGSESFCEDWTSPV